MSKAPSWCVPPFQPLLQGSQVHVWLWDLLHQTQNPDLLAALLSADERLRMSRFHFAQDRSLYLVSHAILRQLLGGYLGCPPADVRFIASARGKPELAAAHGTLYFNLSHTKQMAVAAVTRGAPLGIDIEHVSRNIDLNTGQHVFSPEENLSLLRLPHEQRRDAFFRCWVRKEALCKAEGYGLSEATAKFSVSLGPFEPPRIQSAGGVLTRAWSLFDLPAHGDLIGSLATDAALSGIDYFTFPD